MKLKLLTVALLALSFTACDTYEETDDVANQRAEQEAFVKAENLKDAYNEYASAYSDWYKKSDSITSIEKKINKYKQSLILLENGYDEATVEAMKESEKAQYEAELTVAQARLEILEAADVDVEILKTKIDSLDNAILALGDNESLDAFDASKTALDDWNTKYNEGNVTTFIFGKGYDADIWEEKALVTKNNLSIAIEPLKDDLDVADEELADEKVIYDAALEAYTTAKTARDEAKATKDAAQTDVDAANEIVNDAVTAENIAQEAYDKDNSNANKDLLDSAKENVTNAQESLDNATSELNDAIAAFNIVNSEYETKEDAYKTETTIYEAEKESHRVYEVAYVVAVRKFEAFDIEALKAELTELNATYTAANVTRVRISAIVAEKEELENTMFFIEANYSNVSDTEDYIDEKITTVKKTIEDLEINLAKIAAGVYNLSSDIVSNNLTATQIQEAIANYEAKLVASNDLLAAAKTQLDNAKAAYEALLAQNTETDDDEEVPAGE